MFGFTRRRKWPELPFDEIKKRAQVLVIDDEDFAYKLLFNRDGYRLDKWDDIDDLPKLENGYYDLILLDIQGVGREHSHEQGLGVLKHLRAVNPVQIIVAYSNADWSLRYQEFFRMADATLAKGADYVEFKRTVDNLLKQRFSLGFYLDKIVSVLGDETGDPRHMRELAEKAILTGKTRDIEKALKIGVEKTELVTTVLSIVKSAITLAAALC